MIGWRKKSRVLLIDRLVTYSLMGVLPMAVILTGVLMIANPWWIKFEYNQTTFPEDPWGLERNIRTRLATRVVDFIKNQVGVAFLQSPVDDKFVTNFNDREIRHLEDVRIWFGRARVLCYICWMYIIGAGFYLQTSKNKKGLLWWALVGAGLMGLNLTMMIAFWIWISWGSFFHFFHQGLFAPGTWSFEADSLLIRLFPERFWVDSFVVVVFFSSVVFLGLSLLPREWLGKKKG